MDLVSRLKQYLDSRQISVTQFADVCGIPRPTASQLLAGRNKKVSDEIINKIHNFYPDLSILWLMFGEGEMTANANNADSQPHIAASDNDAAPYLQMQTLDLMAMSLLLQTKPSQMQTQTTSQQNHKTTSLDLQIQTIQKLKPLQTRMTTVMSHTHLNLKMQTRMANSQIIRMISI